MGDADGMWERSMKAGELGDVERGVRMCEGSCAYGQENRQLPRPSEGGEVVGE